MRVTIPGGISILSACLKRAGYNDIELFANFIKTNKTLQIINLQSRNLFYLF